MGCKANRVPPVPYAPEVTGLQTTKVFKIIQKTAWQNLPEGSPPIAARFAESRNQPGLGFYRSQEPGVAG
jgi:hypothetical protein